jgi:hypothetical protein
MKRNYTVYTRVNMFDKTVDRGIISRVQGNLSKPKR